MNYWGKFSTQTNFLKQYTYADFFGISQREWPICNVFCFLRLFKESMTFYFVFKLYKVAYL